MEPLIRTPFTSWDGLEVYELNSIKTAIRDIENSNFDIQQQRDQKIPFAKEEKRLKRKSAKLGRIVREWVKRYNPAINQRASFDININDEDRIRFGKLYDLIQEGLENPIKAKDATFLERLGELGHPTNEIIATDSNEIEEPLSGWGDHMDFEATTVIDKEMIDEEANRIVFSPPPDFGDVEEMEDEELNQEEMVEFEIARTIKYKSLFEIDEENLEGGKEADDGGADDDESDDEESDDGEADDGGADDDESDDEESDDGEADDGGAEDDGGADDNESDDGEPDGGEPDGGEPDGGESDDNESDGREPDGGESDGGESDDEGYYFTL